MIASKFAYRIFRRRMAKLCAKTIVLVALVAFGSLVAGRQASADGGVAAAAVASAGLGACSSSAGKVLYGCVADVLDKMSNQISGAPETQRSLAVAASQLRAAVNKVQALSAITQCRAVVAGVLRQVLASGGSGKGLSAVANVLAQAARLIQSKG